MDVLLTVLGVVLAMALITALSLAVAALVGLRSLRRRNRVSPDEPTEVPLVWLSSPAAPARLHRRLRSAVAVARTVTTRRPGQPASDAEALAVASRLERRAVDVDRQLAAIHHLTAPERRRLARHLSTEVVAIEQMAAALSLLVADDAAPARLPHHPTETEALAMQLDAMREARREVSQAEATSGITSPTTLPAATPAVSPRRRPRA